MSREPTESAGASGGVAVGEPARNANTESVSDANGAVPREATGTGAQTSVGISAGISAGESVAPPLALDAPAMFANLYCWFVLLSAMDIILTHTILFRFKELGYFAAELNTFADWVIRKAGLWGAILLKCASIVTVVFIIEVIGRRRRQTAHTLACCVVAMATVPVFVALVQMAAVAF
jgi:hypothetical protein